MQGADVVRTSSADGISGVRDSRCATSGRACSDDAVDDLAVVAWSREGTSLMMEWDRQLDTGDAAR